PATPLTSWLGKSFDTFAPMGPCIATADEIADPNDVVVRFWNDGQLRHNYNTDDMEIETANVGRMALTIKHPLKRSSERGVHMGTDSTNPDAVKRHRPQA